MIRPGLTRVPFYPELLCLTPGGKDYEAALTLSFMLYWYGLKQHRRFNLREHLNMTARALRLPPEAVQRSLKDLVQREILSSECRTFTTQSDNPDKQHKQDEFLTLDFAVLQQELRSHGLDIPQKVLRLCSSDLFDFYAYLSPLRLPLIQGCRGLLKGSAYEQGALLCARILCALCTEESVAELCANALAPGWRMLAQPPATPEEVAARWCREGDRSIDIDLTDGSVFVPDGNFFGAEDHHSWHSSKREAPRILAAALYLGLCTVSADLEFYSDLKEDELTPALTLLEQLTGLRLTLPDSYYRHQQTL